LFRRRTGRTFEGVTSTRTILLGVGLLLGCCASALSEPMLTYRDRTGSVDILIHIWKETLADGSQINSVLSDGDVHRVQLDDTNATMSYRFASPVRRTAYLARREGDELVLNGTFKGAELSRRIPINANPWYESMEWSLADYALSGSTQPLLFWVVNPFEAQGYEMQAIGEGPENIADNGQSVPALRVRVRPAGLLALFWSTLYWFRPTDGRFLRYEGVRGFPGTPMTVVELMGGE
jgi:hypothetical protein